MSAKVVLQVISGPIQGKVFEFDTHDTFLFGRSKECHARLPKDGYVSRHHFLLEVNPPEATIRDLGSLNGTHVNGVRYGGRKADPPRRTDRTRTAPGGLEGPRRDHGGKDQDPRPRGCAAASDGMAGPTCGRQVGGGRATCPHCGQPTT